MTRLTLEVAVSTPDEAARAEAGGADRLELSSGLELGGLTPSPGTFRAARDATALPVYVLLRPRPGGFWYSDAEFAAMAHDAEAFMAAGAAGLVLGVLTPDGEIDRHRCRTLAEIAAGAAVFHRAFDLLPDPWHALDELAGLGFRRVLTSGGAGTAAAGAARLASLVRHAGRRVEILPAGGIRPGNVAELVRETGCDQVHSAARSVVSDPVLAHLPRLAVGMGADESGLRAATDVELVVALRAELDRLAAPLSSQS